MMRTSCCPLPDAYHKVVDSWNGLGLTDSEIVLATSPIPLLFRENGTGASISPWCRSGTKNIFSFKSEMAPVVASYSLNCTCSPETLAKVVRKTCICPKAPRRSPGQDREVHCRQSPISWLWSVVLAPPAAIMPTKVMECSKREASTFQCNGNLGSAAEICGPLFCGCGGYTKVPGLLILGVWIALWCFHEGHGTKPAKTCQILGKGRLSP